MKETPSWPSHLQRSSAVTGNGSRPACHPSATASPVTGAQRWCDAVAELGALQEHYQDCLDRLPDSLRNTAYGDRLQIIVEADIEALEKIKPPRGYGRDT